MPDYPNPTTTINAIEMADLLNLLQDVSEGRKFQPDRQRRAMELRESIIAGTPEHLRVTR